MSDSSNTSKGTGDLRDAEILIKNKNVSFLWLIMITQLFYCFMYGFFMRVNSVLIVSSEDFVHTTLLLLLVIGGFGLAFAYPARMVWSSLGYNLLIAALAIETFFLVNAFWIKAKVFLGTSQFTVDTYTIALTPGQTNSPATGANLNQAIKAALSCIVAFSFIKGRAGLLQAYFITIAGTIVYELARQTCLNNYVYEVGSIKIFFFGGVLGYIASIVVSRLGAQANYENHYLIYQSKKSIVLNLIGTIFCWALFPLLTRDATMGEVSQTQQTRVFSVVLAMSSAALLSIFISGIKYGFHLIINSTIGAGIAILSSTAYISNPVYGIVFGLSSALFQLLFHAVYLKLEMRTDPNLFVFIGQGFLGIMFETINRRVAQTNSNRLTYVWDKNSRPEIILGNGAITAGMAILLGLILGAFFSCCAYHEEVDHYHDFTYWVEGDGLTHHDQITVKKIDDQQQKDHNHNQEHYVPLPNFYQKNAKI